MIFKFPMQRAPHLSLGVLKSVMGTLLFRRHPLDEINSIKKFFLGTFNNYSECRLYYNARFALLDFLLGIRNEIGEKREVLVPAFTCSVVCDAVLRAGFVPIFYEISEANFCIDVGDVKKKLTTKTAAIILQDTFGISAETNELKEIALQRKIVVIQDYALAVPDPDTDLFGDLVMFSFDHTKPINTIVGGVGLLKTTGNQDHSPEAPKQRTEFVIVLRYLYEIIGYRFPFNSILYLSDRLINRLMDSLPISRPFLNDCSFRSESVLLGFPSTMLPVLSASLTEYYRNAELDSARARQLICILKDLDLVVSDAVYGNLCTRRIVFTSQLSRDDFSRLFALDQRQMLFKSVIESTNKPLSEFNYQGTCGISERIAQSVINVPVLASETQHNLLVRKLLRYQQ